MDSCRVAGPRGLCRPLDGKQGFSARHGFVGSLRPALQTRAAKNTMNECQLFWARRTPGGLEQVITYKERRVPRRRTRRKIVFFQLDYFRKIKAGCIEQSQARPENTLYAMAGGFESFDLYRLMAERSLAGCRYSLRIFALPHRSGETLGRGPRSQPRTPMATGQRRSRQFRRV